MNGQSKTYIGNDTGDAIGIVLPYENYEVHDIMASIIVDNTLGRIKKFADNQRAAEIFMSLFLMSFWNSHSEKQKETGKGVLKVIGEYQLSSELQQFVDEENEKVSKDTLKLTVYLMKNGRDDDIEKAEKDPIYLKELLAEFRSGQIGAN